MNFSFAAFHDLSVMWTACLFMVWDRPLSVFFITPKAAAPPLFRRPQIRAFLDPFVSSLLDARRRHICVRGKRIFLRPHLIGLQYHLGGDHDWLPAAITRGRLRRCSSSDLCRRLFHPRPEASKFSAFKFCSCCSRVNWANSRRRVGFSCKPSMAEMTEETGNSVMMYVAVLIMSFTALSILLGMTGLDVLSAFSGAATALSNACPGIGDVIGPTGNFATARQREMAVKPWHDSRSVGIYHRARPAWPLRRN